MVRRLYQMTLIALQVALMLQIVPPLALALRNGVAFGAFPEGALAVIQIASAVAAIAGGALALSFPCLALLRHRQRGCTRFSGLPRWAVGLALAGAIVFVLGIALNGIVPLFPPGARMTAVLTARPVINAGLALMAAGVVCAEFLRRSVGVPRIVIVSRDARARRVEVTYPPELATHVA